MSDAGDRRTWFGLGGRPGLPSYLRSLGIKRARVRQPRQMQPARIRREKRLKGLEEFEKPAFAGRMARLGRRKKLEWWAMVAVAFAVGGAIGWWLI
jgi:hypothetical protein